MWRLQSKLTAQETETQICARDIFSANASTCEQGADYKVVERPGYLLPTEPASFCACNREGA